MFSVLISVYHGDNAEYFDRAMHSIWDDQILKPNQIVLVKDGKISNILEDVVRKWKQKIEEKLTIVQIKNNSGLSNALNEGVKSCKYNLIARMDSDDLSTPERFYKQVKFMNENQEVSVCSAYIEERDDNLRNILSIRKLPVKHKEIVNFAKMRSPMNHPAVMYRKSVFLEGNFYPDFYPEDYPFWCILIAKGYIFANIPEVLLYMRSGEQMLSRRGYKILKGTIKTYILMRRIGLISWPLLVRNSLIQFSLRVSPVSVRKILYRYARM